MTAVLLGSDAESDAAGRPERQPDWLSTREPDRSDRLVDDSVGERLDPTEPPQQRVYRISFTAHDDEVMMIAQDITDVDRTLVSLKDSEAALASVIAAISERIRV